MGGAPPRARPRGERGTPAGAAAPPPLPRPPPPPPPPRPRHRLPPSPPACSAPPAARPPRLRSHKEASGRWRGPGAAAPHFLVPAAAARRQRRGPGRETDISFEPAVEPVTNHWPEPGTNLQCGPGWLPPQIGCLVGQKMAAKEPVPARSPASRSRAALPPRRLPATRAGSSPQRAPSRRRRPGPALPASFMRTEAPGLGGRRARLPGAEGRRGPRGWAEVKPPVRVRLQASGLPGRAVPRKRALSRGVQGCCWWWWWLRGGVAALARGWGKGNPGRWGTGERVAFPAVPRWPCPRPRPRWLQRQGAAVSRAGTVVAEGR